MVEHFDGNVMIVIDGLDEIERDRRSTLELLRSLSYQIPRVSTHVSSASETLGDEQLEITSTTTNIVPSNQEPSKDLALALEEMASDSTDLPASVVSGSDLTHTHSHSRVKLLFVSRTASDIEEILSQFDKQIIEANKDDIDLYVLSEVDRRMRSGELRFGNSSLKRDIIEELVKNAQGM
jgi:hypothetical protein